jgi:Ca-activated chloride channel family protein
VSLDHPLRFILALLVCAAVIAAVVWIARNRRGGEVAYSNLAFLAATLKPQPWIERSLFALFALGLLIVATAFSGPHLTLPVPVTDGTVFICIDTSGSMASTDVAPTRAQAAQAAARAFVAQTPAGTRIGIIAFSTDASVLSPLTADRTQLEEAIASLPAPNGATAIGDALALAAQRLPARGHRVVILITDGVNNHGVDPQAEAQKLGASHVTVYTVGIGTDNGDLIPGTEQQATIDEDALRAYAQAGGGAYARADSAASLREALASLGRVTSLERKKIDASLGFALGGGIAMLAAFLIAFALGRVP